MGASQKPEMPAYLLAALSIVGIVALTILHHPVPDILNIVTVGAIGAGAAITTPNGKGGSA